MNFKVSLIVDHSFGMRLKDIAIQTITWICNSSENRAAVKDVRKILKRTHDKRKDPLTTFEYNESDSVTDLCIKVLPTIEEHHPWVTLEVYGTQLEAKLRENLVQVYGITGAENTPFGFRVKRGELPT